MPRLISSGSLTPGVSVADFRLPAGTALRCERPADTVRRFAAGYFVMDSVIDYQPPGTEWMLPTCAQIWVVLTAGSISVEIGRRRYPKVPPAFLYGPTSRAMPITSNGGITVGIEITPIGWARLIAASAEDLRDRLFQLETVIAPELATSLATTLAAYGRGAGVKNALDTWFAKVMTIANRDETAILTVMRILADETSVDVAASCRTHGIDPRLAARVAGRYFGFPLKLLIMRGRFLRAVIPMLQTGVTGGLPVGYHDRSHFLRDSARFLGMTPARYLMQHSVYVAAVCRARKLVLGAPVANMDPVPD